MVLTGRKIPPTLLERKANRRARLRRYFNLVLFVAAVLAPFVLALALWLLTRNEFRWGVTVVCLDLPLWVAAYVRLTDAPAVEMPR